MYNTDIGDRRIGADDQAAHFANTAEAFYGPTTLNSAFERTVLYYPMTRVKCRVGSSRSGS
jgi:hypothetical protein